MEIIPNTKVIGIKDPIIVKNHYLEYVKNVNLPFSSKKTIIQLRFWFLICPKIYVIDNILISCLGLHFPDEEDFL